MVQGDVDGAVLSLADIHDASGVFVDHPAGLLGLGQEILPVLPPGGEPGVEDLQGHRYQRYLVGGVEHGGQRGRGTRKCIVVIAVEVRQPKGFGRVRMRHVPDVSAASLLPFVRDALAPGTVVLTDGWSGYNSLTKHGYQRQKIVVSSSGDPAHVSLPGVHRVASLLKRWILGTHQGAITADHLQSYLEEFTFRFNRRTSRNRGLVFHRLLQQAVATGPVTESDVTCGYDW